LLLRKGHDDDRAAWNRASHHMALLYNINRGKARALSAEDFTPYGRELPHAAATVMTDELESDLVSFGNIMQNGTRQ